jgi:predicted KAP-like P-loop ATPase
LRQKVRNQKLEQAMWRDSESDKDFLNFSELAEQIATLVGNQALLPISVGVFGGWGTGKSTVLRLLEAKLLANEETKRPLLIKFDAWMYQGFDDARAALMEVISNRLIDASKQDASLLEKAKKFSDRVNYFRALGMIADFGAGMAFGIPPGLLTRAGTAFGSIFSGSGSSKEVDEIKQVGGDMYDDLKSLIKPEKSRTPPKEIEAFRREFSELLEELDRNLVVFIDNLDRCLPDVAISTLEAIRLFLFIPRTAFVIAADEGMIRHSVAKHFNDPQASHVRDYLDKVIQVPLRVPQVGAEDLRAYMYSLFVEESAPDKLAAVQSKLMQALQGSWRDETFDKSEVATIAGSPKELLDNLAIADRLAPLLATAPEVQGNPRIVKRLLNSVSLRRLLAKSRGMSIDLSTLAKLAVFERCTDESATLALYRLVMEGKLDAISSPKAEGKEPELPEEWNKHRDFVQKWRLLDPDLNDLPVLRAAVFLSRDVMAPARTRTDVSDAARVAIEALLKVSSVTSPVASKVIEQLSLQDQLATMSGLIAAMREADWTIPVPGIHGAILLARASKEAREELKSFSATLPMQNMDKGMLFLLKTSKLVQGDH